MMATHNLSKPLNVLTPQAHKPTILNLHPNNVTILSSSTSGGNWRVLRQEMCLRDRLQPTETMGLSGPDPKAVATKTPITRMCMCQNKRVPSWRSVKLEFLGGGDAPSEALLVAKRARLNPHLLDNAECEFKEILWKRDLVEFKDLEKCAWRMEMSGKEDAAVKDLERYISCKSKRSEEIYKARLVLVEMLIYQGDYGRARQTSEELKVVQPPNDYRPAFYLAIICALLCNEEEAKNLKDEAKKHEDEAKSHWNVFKEKFETYCEPTLVEAKNLKDEAKEFENEAKSHWNEFKEKFEKFGDPPPVEAKNLKDEAKKFEDEVQSHWNEFKKKFEEHGEPTPEDETPAEKPMVLGFDQFKEHIKVLGQEIDAVRYNRAT